MSLVKEGHNMTLLLLIFSSIYSPLSCLIRHPLFIFPKEISV